MPLLPARCPNCNGELDVDNKYPRMTCSYCGTVFLVEQAIQQYNNTFNINTQSVNIYGGESADTMVEGINKWINAGFFDKAKYKNII